MDMSVYKRLVQDDVTTLGYFPAEEGVYHLVLVSGRPHLATVDTVPLRLEPLSEARFFTVAARLLDGADGSPRGRRRRRARRVPRSASRRGARSACMAAARARQIDARGRAGVPRKGSRC